MFASGEGQGVEKEVIIATQATSPPPPPPAWCLCVRVGRESLAPTQGPPHAP